MGDPAELDKELAWLETITYFWFLKSFKGMTSYLMKKLGSTGRLWLKGFHIFFCCAWIGTGLSIMLLQGDDLYARCV